MAKKKNAKKNKVAKTGSNEAEKNKSNKTSKKISNENKSLEKEIKSEGVKASKIDKKEEETDKILKDDHHEADFQKADSKNESLQDSKEEIEHQKDVQKSVPEENICKIEEQSDQNKSNKNSSRAKEKKWPAGRIFKWTIGSLLCIGYLVAVIGCFVAYDLGSKMIKAAPELKMENLLSSESSKVYDSEGVLIADLGEYLRENISYDDLPESLIDAFVSIEDSRFFEHNGFDVPRFTKAFLEIAQNALRTHQIVFSQGGSTFTMQLIKNSYFTLDAKENSTIASKSIDRKVQEIYMALNLEQTVSKEEIFEMYVNKLNFGGNIRGVQKAAQYYFGKDAKELTLSESALLAGIVNLPNSYNPYYHLDWATDRRNEVLDLMVYHGYIAQDEANLAKSIRIEDLLVGENYIQKQAGGSYQGYLDAVINEVIDKTGKSPYDNSMEIYTCLKRTVQDEIDAIQAGENENVVFLDENMQVAIVSMNNQTGEIVGLGGGRNYDEAGARAFNRATQMYNQPGSSVKPFLSYALAFDYLGWATDHVITDRPYVYRGTSLRLQNFDGKYRGDVLLNEAVAASLNTPAIQTLQEVLDTIGRDAVIEYLQDLGFDKVSQDNFDTGFGIGGSTFTATPVQLAGAHAALINGGKYIEPHTISRIVFADGSEYIADTEGKQVISEEAAYMTATLEQYCVDGPFFNYMQILRREYPIYAKTGTSDWGTYGMQYGIPRGAAKDKWMVSSSSQYTNVVWLGYDKAEEGVDTWFNSYKSSQNIPGKISKEMLDVLHEDMEEKPAALVRPEGVVSITHIIGTFPYVAPIAGMDSSLITTGLIKKEFAVLSNTIGSSDTGLNSFQAHFNEEGALVLTWGTGNCVNGVKDISLHENGVNYEATGRCYFDWSMLTGSGGSKAADIMVNGEYLRTVWAEGSSTKVWDLDRNASIQACGFIDGASGSRICVDAN